MCFTVTSLQTRETGPLPKSVLKPAPPDKTRTLDGFLLYVGATTKLGSVINLSDNLANELLFKQLTIFVSLDTKELKGKSVRAGL
jgi:hypothetical protein